MESISTVYQIACSHSSAQSYSGSNRVPFMIFLMVLSILWHFVDTGRLNCFQWQRKQMMYVIGALFCHCSHLFILLRFASGQIHQQRYLQYHCHLAYTSSRALPVNYSNNQYSLHVGELRLMDPYIPSVSLIQNLLQSGYSSHL